MKIAILNGSPKGKQSVTMQYAAYLEKKFPGHEFEYIHASLYCKKMENDPAYFSEVMSVIKNSDVVLWAFPLYYLLVQSQYKRFIELVFERGMQDVFRNRYAAALSTSIHFYDNTAHNYIRAICDDLEMKYVDFHPARMDDLREEKGRLSLEAFFRRVERHVIEKIPASRAYAPVSAASYSFSAGLESGAESFSGVKAVIVADMEEGLPGVENMARCFASRFENAEVINIRGMEMGPCQGCLKCGFDNVCAYDGKDNFIPVLQNTILKADILVFALGMHDRYFSHVWQRYLERNFVNTHKPVLDGRQVAFLVSGPLSQNHNAREILQAYTETMKGSFAGIVTDESMSDSVIREEVDALARDMKESAEMKTSRPATFLGVAGMKVFRDDIYAGLRFVFQGDHRYYRSHGMYDFPQKNVMKNLGTSFLVLLTKIPALRKKIRNELKAGMIRPFRKVLS